jgi:hypothetical protein
VTTGVSVTVDVGRADVGVSLGGSGVGENAAAVSVNSATTVFAAEVRMASRFGVGAGTVAGAQAARRSADKATIGNHFFMFLLLPVLLYFISFYRLLLICPTFLRNLQVKINFPV